MKWWKVVLFVLGGVLVIGAVVFLLLFGGPKGSVNVVSGSPVKLIFDGADYGEGTSFFARLPVGNHKLEAALVGMAGNIPIITKYFEGCERQRPYN